MENKYFELNVEPDGYMKSFTVDEKEDYKTFFDKYGFVVIRDIISSTECDISCDEVWASLKEKEPNIDRNDPKTWSEKYWPKDICRRGGFINKFPYWKRLPNLKEIFVAQQPQAWKNRENPTIYGVFRHLFSTGRLWGSIDRYGIMRPSNHQQQSEINETWATKHQWLHWDLSPFHFGTSAAGFAPRKDLDFEALKQDYGEMRVQGLITMTDCPVQNGGFHCVPGFQHQFMQWRNDNIDDYGSRPEICKRNFIEVPEDDEMRKHIFQVPMRKGSLLIWNSQLPHGNFPNQSSDVFRMVQYVKFIPVDNQREFDPAISACDFNKADWFPEDYELTPLGKRLYGLEDWDQVE
jgi:hypothetical protein